MMQSEESYIYDINMNFGVSPWMQNNPNSLMITNFNYGTSDTEHVPG